jgi:uncharacterized protein YcfL
MKKIILLALTALMMVGCYQAKANHDKQTDLVGDYEIKTIVYQGCEYVVIESHFQIHAAITHKGNCKYCEERRKQDLKELVEQIKEK